LRSSNIFLFYLCPLCELYRNTKQRAPATPQGPTYMSTPTKLSNTPKQCLIEG